MCQKGCGDLHVCLSPQGGMGKPTERCSVWIEVWSTCRTLWLLLGVLHRIKSTTLSLQGSNASWVHFHTLLVVIPVGAYRGLAVSVS